MKLILSIKTDQPEAEIGLFSGETELAYEKWTADRQLAYTIHHKIKTLLQSQKKEFKNLNAIVCFEGPGSFTGLRIGLSVGNALAFGLQIPVVGSTGENWKKNGIEKIVAGENDKIVIPEYGAPPHITTPKH